MKRGKGASFRRGHGSGWMYEWMIPEKDANRKGKVNRFHPQRKPFGMGVRKDDTCKDSYPERVH
ncbi:MAG: hypothetical protein PHI48_00925 [Bacteroidales bacterium]|nr:hypothetical protein [Bacteroidales bacterium]